MYIFHGAIDLQHVWSNHHMIFHISFEFITTHEMSKTKAKCQRDKDCSLKCHIGYYYILYIKGEVDTENISGKCCCHILRADEWNKQCVCSHLMTLYDVLQIYIGSQCLFTEVHRFVYSCCFVQRFICCLILATILSKIVQRAYGWLNGLVRIPDIWWFGCFSTREE